MVNGIENGFSDGWPAWAKPAFALAAAAMWIGVPIVAAWSLADRTVHAGGVVDYQPILVVLVAMTTATVTGVFVFMTFRIDRGTRQKAERVAKVAADDALKEVVNESKRALNDTKDRAIEEVNRAVGQVVSESDQRVGEAIRTRLEDGMSPQRIREEIASHINEDMLQKHIEAVLMVEANSQVVAKYATEHAKDLSEEAATRLIRLMNDVIQSLSGHLEAEQTDEDAGWLEKLKMQVGWSGLGKERSTK